MPVEIRTGNHFWLRDEVKPGERRTPILPEHAKKLVDAGHRVTVESSSTRCVKDEEYVGVGCEIVKSGTWRTEAPKDAFVLGLKELDVGENNDSLAHRHVYFGHAYKNQSGWQDLLRRFIQGQGALLDLEFLTFENGVRVAAFGRCAGFIGMATGIMAWCLQQQDRAAQLPTLSYYDDFTHLTNSMRELLKGRKPKVLVIGALGRCGRGAVSLAEQVGLEPIKWDLEETKAGGPFPQLLDVDILINCIYLSKPIAPFITTEMLQTPSRKLSVVVDVSCDFTNPNNPIPIYKEGTTFFNPTIRIVDGENPIDVVSIDHLPSLVPWESSKEFADALIEHLVVCDDSEIWGRVRKLFEEKTAALRN